MADKLQPTRDYPTELNMGDQERQRLAKLYELREAGIDPYPPRSHRTHTAKGAIAEFEEWEAANPAPEGEAAGHPAHDVQATHVELVGRLRLRRPGGKITFTH